MKSTKDYPDEVINFMRNHPTMYNAVYPLHKRPLVVRTNVDYEFTTITVDQVTAADGNYEVLFLGTGECVGGVTEGGSTPGLRDVLVCARSTNRTDCVLCWPLAWVKHCFVQNF